MRVSTKGRYGLRVLLDIALYQGDGVVALHDISRRQAISQKYLWQVINPLKAAGLLRSVRGAHGGYSLARRPEEISLRDVVSILEGDTSVVACVGKPETCERSSGCTTRGAWAEVEGKLNDALSGITLAVLVERERARAKVESASYVI